MIKNHLFVFSNLREKYLEKRKNFICHSMNLITNCLRQCWSTSEENSPEILSDYYINIHNLAKNCLHISNKKDLICEKCFYKFFIYDRFIIRQLFIYLDQQQTNFISIKDFYLFAQKILNWHEYINHIEFILQLFHIILSTNFNQNSIYQLITDAFFFTAIQSNVQTNLTSQSQVS